ncbi:MAG: response regulator transcription factor [Chloroflexi bacterium]|nr:response regulator transcription factor [Chloroflexota bacterium]
MRVLIADDHEVVREGLRTLLQHVGDIEVVAEAGTVQESVDAAKALHPDVVIMDVRLADGSGVEACRAIRDENPDTKVIMLTAFPDDSAVMGSIMAGASGYLLKQARGNDLVDAVRRVGRGESLLDPGVTQGVMARIRSISNQKAIPSNAPSEQEVKVLKLIADGMTNKQIASTLFLSEKTVKNYVSSILVKLDLSRRAEAAAYYVRNISPNEV